MFVGGHVWCSIVLQPSQNNSPEEPPAIQVCPDSLKFGADFLLYDGRPDEAGLFGPWRVGTRISHKPRPGTKGLGGLASEQHRAGVGSMQRLSSIRDDLHAAQVEVPQPQLHLSAQRRILLCARGSVVEVREPVKG